MSSWAAIAFDAATDGGNNGGTTNSLTWNHTVTGAHPLLHVCLMGDTITGGHDDITAATFNSVTMTLAAKYVGANSNNNRFGYLYFLANAPTGTHAVSFTSTASHFLLGVSASYTGTSSSQPDNTALFPASGTSPFTTSITTNADNSWVLTCEAANTAGPTVTCLQRVFGAAFNEPVALDNVSAVTPPGSASCGTRSNLVTNNDVHIMMSIAPFTAAGIHHKVSGN